MKESIKQLKTIKPLFLGPKAENQELYESLINEIIKDSCFLRKNFHPTDQPVISEQDKLSDDFRLTTAEIKQELQNILSELKRGVPLYHPRYIGHMHGDLLISAIAGYFGTILYNSNNIVGESSPATTRMEFHYISKLAQMVGYRPMVNADSNLEQSWGHLCSGGTAANMEALWVARNMKYYPIAVKIASLKEKGCEFFKVLHGKTYKKKLGEFSFSELFNFSPSEILYLKKLIYDKCPVYAQDINVINKLISQYEVVNLGVHGIHQMVNEVTAGKEILKLPKLYYAKSYHYSWDKAIDLIGIGHQQIVKVPIDKGFRMDFEQFQRLYDRASPTLAVIAILGSSKQGSIDPIDDLVEFRKDLERNENKSFHLHIDGAYGGYFPCLLKKNDGQIITANELVNNLEIKELDYFMPFEVNEKWLNKVLAVKDSDSITIDPHKMGYIPYPAGSIIFSDTRCKDFVSYLPSYLNKPDESKDISEEFLGQWTLEGSRPGAVATACYLSEKVLPYHKDAHGKIVANTIQAAFLFWKSLQDFNKNPELNQGFKIVPAFTPETNIVSYLLSYPGVIRKVEHLNTLTKELYNKFSVKGDTVIPAINYMVAKEDFKIIDIEHTEILKNSHIDTPKNKQEELVLLSSVFMNPLSVFVLENRKDFYLDFWKEIVSHAKCILSEIMMQIVYEKNKGEKIRILWVEDDDKIAELNKNLQYKSSIAQYVYVDFKTSIRDINNITNFDYDAYILDLNLIDKHHKFYKSEKIKLTIKILHKLGYSNHHKVLFYSKFFNDEEKFNNVMLDLQNENIKPKDYQIIPKYEFSKDLSRIVDGIFRIVQSNVAI